MKKSRAEVIKLIQEITKSDEYTITQAIEACQDSDGRYSMETVLNVLMDEVCLPKSFFDQIVCKV